MVLIVILVLLVLVLNLVYFVCLFCVGVNEGMIVLFGIILKWFKGSFS